MYYTTYISFMRLESEMVHIMRQMTRRDALRSGGALALTASIAGCLSDGGGGTVAAVSTIPGVEDGEIVDSHTLANAHSDQLADRSATVNLSRFSLDTGTGDPEFHTVTTTQVEGERVYAVMAGRGPFLAPDADRMEVYYDGDTGYTRRRSNGEWNASEISQGSVISRGGFTGENTLEVIEMSEIGTETLNGDELHRFGKTARVKENGQSARVRIQALIDENGLVHDLQQTGNYTTDGIRDSLEWFVDDLGETTVEEPDWIDDVDD